MMNVTFISFPPQASVLYPLFRAPALVLLRAQKDFEVVLNSAGLSRHQALAFAAEIVNIVAWVHSKRLVWADLKPANFLIVQDPVTMMPRLVACDFATAVQFGTEFSANSGCSALYIPPELLQKTGLRAHCSYDIWSLGVLLFRMLTNNDFWSSDEEALQTLRSPNDLDHHLTKRLHPLKTSNEQAYNLIKDILSPDPAQRPTADQVG